VLTPLILQQAAPVLKTQTVLIVHVLLTLQDKHVSAEEIRLIIDVSVFWPHSVRSVCVVKTQAVQLALVPLTHQE